jgi:flagellar protein FlgJ
MLKGGGQITDYEGMRAERAYARMERAMQAGDPKVFREALADFRQAVDDGVSKLRATATGGAPAAPAAPAGGGTQQRLKFNPESGELE